MLCKVLFKFALRPRGGSVVNLFEFYKTETGKYISGIEVKKSRNVSLTYPGLSRKSFTIFSNSGIQLLAK